MPAVLNTRLVAAVQARAGMRCHVSANLLSTYYLCADVYRSRTRNGDASAATDAWRTLKHAEQRLRAFLTAPFEEPGASTDPWSVSPWRDAPGADAGLAAMAN
jgi:hypothetical protein